MCFVRLTRADSKDNINHELRLACDNIESMHYSQEDGQTTVCLSSGRFYKVNEAIPDICERIDEAIIRQQRVAQQRKGLK